MKFGITFYPQDPPDGRNITLRWQEILAAAEVAEGVGFDGVFVPEHHMMDDAYLPSPLVACGALAGRTRRLEVGTMILQLPLYHPVRVAEDAAIVDVISQGRMRLACGLGSLPDELRLYGIETTDRITRFEEGIDLIRRAWSGEELHHHGQHFKADGKISPLPDNAQLWLGAISDPGVRRAARFGLPWVGDPLHNLAVMSNWLTKYREAGVEHGTQDDLGLVLMRDGWVADSLDEVERVWWPHIRAKHWFYFKEAPAWVLDREPFLADVRQEADFKFDKHHIDRLIVGTPDECIATIRKFHDTLGDHYLVMGLRMPSGPSHQEELRCIRRFGEEVIPAFRR
jgi:alkanesulfonate monooxygenase SsuD/methylene tetrahydromethanopterin reductase-like flavin-dependent oxidoreductase (luciferase family)